MQLTTSALAIAAIAASASAFAPSAPTFTKTTALQSSLGGSFDLKDIEKQLNYTPGKAKSEFAERYGHLVGAEVKTVGEAFAEFTKELGFAINALYKNMVTDIVGSTHLIVVNARFQRDPVWSLGIMTALDLLLKNYPEQYVGEKIVASLFKCLGMDEKEVRAEAEAMLKWAEGKTKEEVEAALAGEDPNSELGKVAVKAKADKYWMYSRYFGLGLLRIMETVGIDMDKDEVYPVMENWMSEKLGKSHLTACSDSDMYFRVKDKLDMMETMMKEIEIREKKRMADRLEQKAEEALRAAERENKLQAEIAAEAEKNRERVS
jgi:photosystem II biogenesis protein Psp29